MSHNCFISFKKEDLRYKEEILKKLGEERIQGKALDRWIDSDDIDYVMELKEEQKSSMPLYADLNKDDDKEEETDDDKKKKEEEDKSDGQKEETEE